MYRIHQLFLVLLVINAQIFYGIEKTVAETTASPAKDIALDSAGTFSCRMRSQQLQGPIKVEILQHGKRLVEASLGSSQTIAFSGMRPGIYQICWGSSQTGYRTAVIRVWSHGQAPPIANDYLSLDQHASAVIRGQYGNDADGGGLTGPAGMRRIFRNPWISAGIISAAIAVPIAVAYDEYAS